MAYPKKARTGKWVGLLLPFQQICRISLCKPWLAPSPGLVFEDCVADQLFRGLYSELLIRNVILCLTGVSSVYVVFCVIEPLQGLDLKHILSHVHCKFRRSVLQNVVHRVQRLQSTGYTYFHNSPPLVDGRVQLVPEML